MTFPVISVSLTTWFPQAFTWQIATYLWLYIKKRKITFEYWHPVFFFWLRTERTLLAVVDISGQVSSMHWNIIPFISSVCFKKQKDSFPLSSSFLSLPLLPLLNHKLHLEAPNSTEICLCTKEGWFGLGFFGFSFNHSHSSYQLRD